jgi:tetratricopeptide (TPR) repeat protein
VVAIVRRLGLPGAWLAGFLFALHPVCVEAVAWISEQKSTLSGVFYLAAGLVYLDFDRTRQPKRYGVASLLFLLALLSKTVIATLPAALLLVLWWQRGCIEGKRDVLPLLPWLVMGAGAGLFTAWVENTYIGAQGIAFHLTALQRVLLAGRLSWFYLGKLIWPADLAFVYSRWNIDTGAWWQYLFPAAALAVIFVLILVAPRSRGPLTACLYFLGTLFPVLGFFNVYPFRYSWAADHFQYLASLGVLVPLAAGGALLAARWRISHSARLTIAILVPGVLAALTWRQSGFYQSNEKLFRAAITVTPGSSMAHNNLGFEIAPMPGRLTEAISEFEAALHLDPDSAEAHENLGLVLSKTPNGLAEAVTHLQTAARLQPDYPESHLNLGSVLARVPGRLPEAISEYETALRLKPDYKEAHIDLGTALSSNPARLAEAIEHYETALRLDPESAQAHYSLANVLARMPGRVNDAVAEYQSALRIRPGYVQARTNLATALTAIPGRMPEAIRQYQEALRIDPESVEAHYDLGLVLAKIPGRTSEAIGELQAVLRLRPGMQQAREMLERLTAQAPSSRP